MKSLVSLVSAVALIVALVGAATVPAYGTSATRDCVPMQTMKAKAHECCKTPATIRACCTDPGDASTQGGPVQSRVNVTPNLVPAPGIFVAVLSTVERSILRADAAAPRGRPVDLAILFSTLLI